MVGVGGQFPGIDRVSFLGASFFAQRRGRNASDW